MRTLLVLGLLSAACSGPAAEPAPEPPPPPVAPAPEPAPEPAPAPEDDDADRWVPMVPDDAAFLAEVAQVFAAAPEGPAAVFDGVLACQLTGSPEVPLSVVLHTSGTATVARRRPGEGETRWLGFSGVHLTPGDTVSLDVVEDRSGGDRVELQAVETLEATYDGRFPLVAGGTSHTFTLTCRGAPATALSGSLEAALAALESEIASLAARPAPDPFARLRIDGGDPEADAAWHAFRAVALRLPLGDEPRDTLSARVAAEAGASRERQHEAGRALLESTPIAAGPIAIGDGLTLELLSPECGAPSLLRACFTIGVFHNTSGRPIPEYVAMDFLSTRGERASVDCRVPVADATTFDALEEHIRDQLDLPETLPIGDTRVACHSMGPLDMPGLLRVRRGELAILVRLATPPE
jgi:hypothetical protein